MARAARWAVVAGMLAAGVLAGCDSADDPVVTPTPSPSLSSSSPSQSPSPSPSVTESGPQVPAAAREKTDAGAEAFITYYIEQSARAWMVPDGSVLDGLSTSSCITCRNLQQKARDLERDKQKYKSTPIRVDKTKIFSSTSSRVVVDLQLTEMPVDLVDAKGTVVEHYPRNKITRAAALVWQEGRWRVDGISE